MTNDNWHILAVANRVNIVGTSGSGKTTFGRKLADTKKVPFIEMDRLFWKPNWEEPTDEEFFPKVASVIAEEDWILDGNYSQTRHIKWPRTQVVVVLNLPFLQTIGRVSLRAIRRSILGKEIWPNTNNRETLTNTFLSRDSVVWWAIKTHRKNRCRYSDLAYFGDYPHLRVVYLRSSEQVTSCLSGVQARRADMKS